MKNPEIAHEAKETSDFKSLCEKGADIIISLATNSQENLFGYIADITQHLFECPWGEDENKTTSAPLVVLEKTPVYLFSWDSVPGSDNEKLIKFLKDDFDIDWAENLKIRKSEDRTICISKGENSAEIKMDEEKKKAILKISDGRTYDLKVKTENGKLNMYKPYIIKNSIDEDYDIVMDSYKIVEDDRYLREWINELKESTYELVTETSEENWEEKFAEFKRKDLKDLRSLVIFKSVFSFFVQHTDKNINKVNEDVLIEVYSRNTKQDIIEVVECYRENFLNRIINWTDKAKVPMIEKEITKLEETIKWEGITAEPTHFPFLSLVLNKLTARLNALIQFYLPNGNELLSILFLFYRPKENGEFQPFRYVFSDDQFSKLKKEEVKSKQNISKMLKKYTEDWVMNGKENKDLYKRLKDLIDTKWKGSLVR